MAVERIDGVRDAAFSYREGTGTVRFDTTVTSAEAIVEGLERATAYRAKLQREP